MPEETAPAPNPPPTQTLPNQTDKNLLLSWRFMVPLVLVLLIASGAFVFVNYFRSGITTTNVVTGLARAQVRIGINSFSGVFPNNVSPPTSDDVQPNDVIFDGLVKQRSDKTIPALATSWTNPNQNTWRFVIRSGVKFTSGDPLTVNDVKYSFDQAMASNANSDTALPSAYEVQNVKDVKIVDNHTIDVETIKPDPIFLLKMLDFYIFSEAQTKRDGLTKAVGTGPYKVTKFVKDKELDLEVNPGYWGTKPKINKVTYLIYPTDESMQTALIKGQIDIGKLRMANIILPAGFSEKIFDEPRVLSLMFNFANTTINKQPNPLLKRDVREALKLAIDQNQVIKDASASGKPANQVLTKSIFGYNPNIPYPKKDLTQAKKLLAENNATNLNMTILTTADKELAAKSIALQLANIGVTANVELQSDFGSLVQKITSGSGQAFVASVLTNDGGEYLTSILSTTGEQNILSYSNPNLDKIIAQASKSFVPKDRKALLQQAMFMAMADDPILPIYSLTDTFLVSDNFDMVLDNLGEIHADSISGREVQTSY